MGRKELERGGDIDSWVISSDRRNSHVGLCAVLDQPYRRAGDAQPCLYFRADRKNLTLLLNGGDEFRLESQQGGPSF